MFDHISEPTHIWLARLPGQILLSVLMGNFSPVDQDENQETKTVKYKLVSFLTIMALLTLVALLIKLIQILLKWKAVSYKTKIMPFGLLCYKGEAVLSKKICPSYPGLRVHVHCQDIGCGN